MYRRAFWLLLCIIGSSSAVYAQQQDFLLLSDYRNSHRITFAAGETIRFRLQGEDGFRTGVIQRFEDDVLVFPRYTLHVSEIAAIDIRHKPHKGLNLANYSVNLPISGVGYFLMAMLRSNPNVRQTTLISGSLVSSGLLFTAIRKKLSGPANSKKLPLSVCKHYIDNGFCLMMQKLLPGRQFFNQLLPDNVRRKNNHTFVSVFADSSHTEVVIIDDDVL